LGWGSGEGVGFKREVGWFSSFAMGYGDVGADIFIALGIVTLYAGGAAPYAFLIAALIYVAVGLAYAELGPTYPYAGGVQVYAMRASNTLLGFLAGWSIMLDYTLDISLFATASAGYLRYLFPWLREVSLQVLPGVKIPSLGVVAACMVALLIFVNYIGVKYSAGLVSGLVVIGLAVQALILAAGFASRFDPGLLLAQIGEVGNPSRFPHVEYLGPLDVRWNNFLYGVTLAMASFIGIESIAQAAEETRKPYKWIPRAAKLCVVTVPLSVILFSILSIGVMDWRGLGSAYENPVAVMVSRFPSLGGYLSIIVSAAAFVLCLASANTGVIGVSRLTASMGKFNLLPSWLYRIHPRFRTPTRTILIFGAIGLLLTLPGDIPLLATLYNFGASLSYLLLMLSLLMLRSRDRDVYRPWKMPVAIKVKGSNGRLIEIPVLGLLGLAGTAAMWMLVVLLHPEGRLFGFLWIGAGLLVYTIYRKLSHRRLLSRDEGGLIIPAGYNMSVAVLVRPFEDPEVVRRSILRSLDKRFSIKLVSIIDLPADISRNHELERLEALRREVEESLAGLAGEFRDLGYEADYEVEVGDFEKIVGERIERGDVDFIAYIVRGFEKASFEKGIDEKVRSVMEKYPGKIMLLKRISE